MTPIRLGLLFNATGNHSPSLRRALHPVETTRGVCFAKDDKSGSNLLWRANWTHTTVLNALE
jgi:hypothetical protein